MRTLLLILSTIMLPGCAVLSAMGLGATDVLPSLKHCSKVDYQRKGLDIDIKAKCQVPVG